MKWCTTTEFVGKFVGKFCAAATKPARSWIRLQAARNTLRWVFTQRWRWTAAAAKMEAVTIQMESADQLGSAAMLIAGAASVLLGGALLASYTY